MKSYFSSLSSLLIIALICTSIVPLRVSADADADDYFARIITNGGTMSVSDQNAITTFVTAAKAHGYWNKLIDVGPLAGNNLSAALVKLKYPVTASSTLVNSNFVSADYSPTTGLQGTSSAPYKWLNTKVNYNTFTNGIGGLSFWVGDSKPLQYQDQLIGLSNNVSPFMNISASPGVYFGGSAFAAATFRNTPDGFYHGIRQALNLSKMFVNGTQVGTSTTVVATTTRSSEITVFAGNRITASSSVVSSNDRKGFFYSIDDGTMTDAEAIAFAADVKELQIGLGRIAPKPFSMKYAMILGQSLAVGTMGNPSLSSTTQRYKNKMFGGGMLNLTTGLQSALGPLTEGTVETIASGFSNFVASTTRSASSTDESQDLTISNWGLGGAAYSQLKKGTGPYTTSIASVVNAKNLSDRYNTSFVVPGLLVVHGEADIGSLTYQADIEQWQSDYETDIKAITGQSGTIPMFHSQSSSFALNIESAYAMLAAYEANPHKSILVTPKYFLTHSDGIHLNPKTYRRLGEYYAKAWNKVVVQGQTWSPLRPASVDINGKDIDITFTGNVGNLVLDTTLVSNPGDFGFKYTDNATSTTIASVSLLSSSTVRITLASIPTGKNKKISYASQLVGTNAGGPTTGPRGNLRDSDPTLSQYDDDNSGQMDNLYNWAVHFEKALPDYDLPIISSITTTAETFNAQISWTTDENSTSKVEYGLTSQYSASTAVDSALVLSHSVNISGLKPLTTYHYRVVSTDAAGNVATSSDQTFTTSFNQGGVSSPTGYGSSAPISTPIPFVIEPEISKASSTAEVSNTYIFSRDLRLGMMHPEVKTLQKYLNAKGFIIAKAGAGSVGKETNYFGPATRAALAKFQKAHTISPAVGYFGPVTKAFIEKSM